MGIGLLHDDGAVSPALGVGLVVGIVVVLVSSSAVVILGVGSGEETSSPEAEFSYEYSQVGHGELRVVYDGGDILHPANLRIDTDGEQFHPAPGNRTGSPSGPAYRSLALDSAPDGSDWVDSNLTAGMEFGIVGATTDSLERATVRIVWEDPGGSRAVVLGEWQGPDA